jgi:hypothetical protein
MSYKKHNTVRDQLILGAIIMGVTLVVLWFKGEL